MSEALVPIEFGPKFVFKVRTEPETLTTTIETCGEDDVVSSVSLYPDQVTTVLYALMREVTGLEKQETVQVGGQHLMIGNPEIYDSVKAAVKALCDTLKVSDENRKRILR